MKKITFFTYDAYPGGGTERVMTMIANELSKKYQVEIISVRKSAEKPFYHINENIKIIDLNLKRTEPLIFCFPFLAPIIKHKLKDYKTDVLICVGMRYVPISIFMRKKAKFIAWEHYNSFVNKRFSVGEVGRKLAIKYASKIIVLTKKDERNYIEKFGANQNNIITIYNPADTFSLSDSYNIESKKLVSVGRIVPQKGFDFLLDVATIVFAKHPDWKWDIFGDGKDRLELETRLNQLSIDKNVFFKGKVFNMKERYKEYSMYIMTSRYEGFPMVNIEAHSAKLPIVSFNCPCGPDELIQDGVNGYIIDCFDINKMAEKINYLIENQEIRQKMSDSTILDKEKLELENIIKNWETIL